ncbi:MAG: HEAT repeat domain-containing protein [Elusimicrobia bacterium]|nr:HEAT repeat domain-containing protein [Elusimicrobiota bacterium]
MTRILLALTLIGGLAYLYQAKNRPIPTAPLPPPPILKMPPTSALSPEEIERVRQSTKDSDASVRWAAIELLYRLHDPQAIEILENMLALDTEKNVRRNALNMLRTTPKPTAIKDLLLALNDQEKDIRISALLALGEIGDATIAPHVSKLLIDLEPEVRLQALHALGRFQEQKAQQYKTLADKLKAQYDDSVRRANQDGAQPYRPDVAMPK